MNKYSVSKLPTDILQDIAAKHKILRKKQGYTQKEMASRAGISHGSLKRFEQKGLISFESLLKLAHLLDRMEDFEDIFFFDHSLDRIKKIFDE